MSQLPGWFKLAFFDRSQYNDSHDWKTGVICQVWQTFSFSRSTGDTGTLQGAMGRALRGRRERCRTLREECRTLHEGCFPDEVSFHNKSAQTQAVQLNPLTSVLIPNACWYTALHKDTASTKHRWNICRTRWCWSYTANSIFTCMAGALTNYKLMLQSRFLVLGARETGILNEQ